MFPLVFVQGKLKSIAEDALREWLGLVDSKPRRFKVNKSADRKDQVIAVGLLSLTSWRGHGAGTTECLSCVRHCGARVEASSSELSLDQLASQAGFSERPGVAAWSCMMADAYDLSAERLIACSAYPRCAEKQVVFALRNQAAKLCRRQLLAGTGSMTFGATLRIQCFKYWDDLTDESIARGDFPKLEDAIPCAEEPLACQRLPSIAVQAYRCFSHDGQKFRIVLDWS